MKIDGIFVVIDSPCVCYHAVFVTNISYQIRCRLSNLHDCLLETFDRQLLVEGVFIYFFFVYLSYGMDSTIVIVDHDNRPNDFEQEIQQLNEQLHESTKRNQTKQKRKRTYSARNDLV
jgi:membrane-anchored glycerophosphoryl diester phosphodiesterase (GDPDase)